MTPLDKLTPRQRWGTCCPNDPECDHSYLDDTFLIRHMDTPLSDFEAEMVVRGWSTDVLRDVQAALPEGHYLGREGVVQAKRVTMARTTVGTAPLREALFVIESVEDQP